MDLFKNLSKSLIKYRFFVAFFQPIVTVVSFFLGGYWLWSGSFFNVILDFLIRHKFDGVGGKYFRLPGLTIFVFLPLAVLVTLQLIYYASSDPALPINWVFSQIPIIDMSQQRAQTGMFSMLGAILAVGIVYSFLGGVVAHELMHDTHNRMSVFLSRLLLAFCFYSHSTIEHVYFHHRNVGLPNDAATCPRGMNLWVFIVRAIYLGNRNALAFESARMKNRNGAYRVFRNRVYHGYALSGLLLLAVFVLSGAAGVFVFTAAALIPVIAIEAVNYVSHYGLARLPGTPIAPRHSWNSTATISSGLLLNLTRHSNHHMGASTPYWELQPPKTETAPMLPLGVMSCAALSLIPPVFYRLIAAPLNYWDHNLASDQERTLAQNRLVLH
jgi:alkane 1-monooxygenase